MRFGRVGLAALVAAPAIAGAQSVTLYGVIDTGVEYVNNIGTAKDSVVRMPTLTGTVRRGGACVAARISAAA